MADDGLDDFFAKKDKSKKKSKASKITPDDLINKQSGDDTVKEKEPKKEKKNKKDRDKNQSSKSSSKANTVGLLAAKEEDEDWKEVEDEEEKDYSGLRIANIQISGKEGEGGGEEEEHKEEEEEGEDGEVREKRDAGQQGPWKGAAPPQPAAPAPTPAPPVEEPPPKPDEETPAAPKGPSKYMPPGARAAAASGGSSGSTPMKPMNPYKKRAAPNITSEEDFPTLGGGAPRQSDSEKRTFEKVQSGGRQTGDASRQAQELSLGNKYAALQD